MVGGGMELAEVKMTYGDRAKVQTVDKHQVLFDWIHFEWNHWDDKNPNGRGANPAFLVVSMTLDGCMHLETSGVFLDRAFCRRLAKGMYLDHDMAPVTLLVFPRQGDWTWGVEEPLAGVPWRWSLQIVRG